MYIEKIDIKSGHDFTLLVRIQMFSAQLTGGQTAD